METGLIKTFGMIAGIGGLALGVLLIIFREIIRKKIFPQLTKEQSYKLFRLIIILVFIVAIVGIAAWVYNPTPTTSTTSAKGDNVSQKKIKPADCTDLKVITFPKIPYYLTTTIDKGRADILYYARLVGTNNCDDTLQIKVKFRVKDPDFAKLKEEKEDREGSEGKKERGWLQTTVIKNEHKDCDLHPKFEFMRPAVQDEIIYVEYHILTLNDEDIRHDTLGQIIIAAQDLVYWDLKGPSGNNVDPQFLLASLSAWWAVKDTLLENQAQRYLNRGETGPSQDWFKKCYTDLFDLNLGSSHLKVNPYSESWPLSGLGEASKQRLCKPTEVVNGKVREIHSLEAAVLLAALVNNLHESMSFRLELWAVPDPQVGNAGGKRFLLSWTFDGREWYALDMTDPNKSAFGDNVLQATVTLRNLRQWREDIVSALKETGVFIEGGKFVQGGKQILALNFNRAATCFNINALP